MRRMVLNATAATVGVLVTVLGAQPAHAATPTEVATAVTCGVTVTTDAYLAADLTCPAGDGVILGAGVTLDLRGHTLSGAKGTGSAGVRASATGTSIVTNGVIQNWGQGVDGPEDALESRGVLKVSSVTFRSNYVGTAIFGMPTEVRRSRFIGNRIAVHQSNASITVRDIDVKSGVEGLDISEATLNLARSVVRVSGIGVDCVESDCAIASTVISRAGIGIRSYNSNVTATRSVLTNNGIGFDTESGSPSTGLFQGNRFAGNRIAVSSDSWNTLGVKKNTFDRNGVGISVLNAGAGFPHIQIMGNRFTRNRDGVYVKQPGTKIGGNTARKNLRWGIYAPGAVDLGGNKASRNGKPQQCVGVRCS